MTYKIASGHNNVAGYATLTIQPACTGLQYAEWVDIPMGRIPQGETYAIWDFSDGITETEWTTVRTEVGLLTVYFKKVTVSLPDEDRVFRNYNATICKVNMPQYRFYYREGKLLLRKIEEI